MLSIVRQNLYSVWTPILFFTLIRLIIAPTFGFGVDEAHYLLYAKHLSLSYFDHPPLVGWLQFPLSSLFGANEFTGRLPAILLGGGTTYLAYQLIIELTNDKKAAFWGATALNSSFVFGAIFLMLMPDTILVFGLLLLFFSFSKLLQNQTVASYAIFGIVLGVCGLAKYTAIIFVVGILIYMSLSKTLSVLFCKRAIVSISIALVLVSPVAIWNIDNHFASFAYQGSHVAGSSTLNILTLGKNLLTQFGAYSPPLFAIAFFGLAKLYTKTNGSKKLLFWLGLTILLFFSFTGLLKPALPHWISPFFVIFIPVGIAILYKAGHHKTVTLSVLFSFVITMLVYGELFFKFGTFPDLKSPFRDIYGWKDASMEAKRLKPSSADIAVLNWSEGSRVSFYTDETVFVADNRQDQFDIWYNQNPIGRDYLFVIAKSSKNSLENKCICAEQTILGTHEARLNGGLVEGFEFVLCKNFQGLKQ